MIRDKKMDLISIGCIVIAIVFSIVLLFPHDVKIRTPAEQLKSKLSDDYANLLFDSSQVHEINILISDLNWHYMTNHATDEQYVQCDAEIDGERISNVAIRSKGNSSLSAISNIGNNKFSFKIKFDAYDKEQTYHGLDKLALGNLGQDPSCMKDFFTYDMMNKMGIPAPLSSYTLVKLNGEDFGLYLAVEAVDESFCYRNYGEDFGEVYKPDSFAMDSLNFAGLMQYDDPNSSLAVTESFMSGKRYANLQDGERVDIVGDIVIPAFSNVENDTAVASLQYVGDNLENYHVIFDTSSFQLTQSDKQRFVNAVKILNTSDTPTEALDTDILLKYFVVHNFVNNYDSYNSLFVHNFYLHEKDGKLSMIPWDYNLGFGSFSYETALGSILGEDSHFSYIPNKGNALTVEKSMVNYPIDTPTYSIPLEQRPLLNVLLTNQETLVQYHAYYDKLLSGFFENGEFEALFARTYEQIKPFISQNLTFYSEAEFERGAEAIHKYCQLRTESIQGQIDGSIPSTTEGQKQHPETLIETDSLNLTHLANFNSLLSGMDAGTLEQVLSLLLQDDYPYNTEGATQAVKSYLSKPSALLLILPDLLKIPAIYQMAEKTVLPILESLVSLIILLISLHIVKRHRRKKNAVKT